MEYRDSARVRELLAQGVLLFDGATGTALCAQSGEGEAVERLCLTQPQRVLALHRAYLAAGCRAIKTNTFAAHVSLVCENEDDQKALIRAAYDLARRAGDAYDAAVFADIGPAPTDADAAVCYIAMAEQFLNVGATCFLFETMQSGEGLAEAAAHIKASCPDAWIMVSFAADADGFTRAGEQVSALALQMSACGEVDAIGLNCICGAYHIRQLLSTLDVGDKLMSAMPNAGYPHVEEGRTYYDSAPAYYAQQVMECVKAGARIVGGCCGTTPEHIRQIARLLGRRCRRACGWAMKKRHSRRKKNVEAGFCVGLSRGGASRWSSSIRRGARISAALWRVRVSLSRRARTRSRLRIARLAEREWIPACWPANCRASLALRRCRI